MNEKAINLCVSKKFTDKPKSHIRESEQYNT